MTDTEAQNYKALRDGFREIGLMVNHITHASDTQQAIQELLSEAYIKAKKILKKE
jgi:hypothetical protein